MLRISTVLGYSTVLSKLQSNNWINAICILGETYLELHNYGKMAVAAKTESLLPTAAE